MDRSVFQFLFTIHIGNGDVELYKQQRPTLTKAVDIKLFTF